jgi:hypothetical protein
VDDSFIFLFGVLFVLAAATVFVLVQRATGRWTAAVLTTGIACLTALLIPALVLIVMGVKT